MEARSEVRMPPSDIDLILACQKGDAEAWSMLVQRYQRLVYAIPRRAGLSEDMTADVFQRVFLKLVEQIQRLEQPDRVSAWLVTTAKRETLAMLQREQTRNTHSVETTDPGTLLEQMRATSPLPDELLDQYEDQVLVRQALNELDERCQHLLKLLFYTEPERSYAEIAALLNMPEGSIGPNRARCLQRLRKLLEARGYTRVKG
jgi:RNA polymerase sigma factor (sigma-70 family)